MNGERSILAVCDEEAEYAYNFMEYLNQKKALPFEVQAFTGPEALCGYAGERHVEILLISGRAMCDAVRRLKVGMLVILSEGAPSPELDRYPSVYKYQSSDNVVREVMSCYGAARPAEEPGAVLKRTAEVIGVYSPVGRVQKTSFALTLGQILARDRAVLYLNMENFSGFERLTGKSYERDLSELLYFARQDTAGLACRVSAAAQSMQNLDFIPPAQSPADIQSTPAEAWMRIIEAVQKESAYEILILDIGDGVAELFRILERCQRIYMPIRSDIISAAKIAQFERLAAMWGSREILERLRKIKPPFHSAGRSGSGYFEGLVWSELGDFVRNELRREESLRTQGQAFRGQEA